MNAPRPRDVVRADLIRLTGLRDRRHLHDDVVVRRRLRAALDRRIDRALDELADQAQPAA